MFIEDNKAMIRRMFGDYHQEEIGHHFMLENIRDHYSSFHYDPDAKHRRTKRSIKPTPLSGNK